MGLLELNPNSDLCQNGMLLQCSDSKPSLYAMIAAIRGMCLSSLLDDGSESFDLLLVAVGYGLRMVEGTLRALTRSNYHTSGE